MANIKDHPKVNTNGFDKRPQDAGRPKKIYTILKDMGYSADDIKTAMGEVAWYTEKDALAVADDKSKPLIVRTIATQYVQALTKKDITKLRELLEYQLDKPKQQIEVDNKQPMIVFKDTQKEDVDTIKDL